MGKTAYAFNPEKLIAELKTRIDPLKRSSELIIIFGSLAKKEFTVKSDVDFFVITKESKHSFKNKFDVLIGNYLLDLGILYHLLIMTPKEFGIHRSSLLINDVLNEGVILWMKEGTDLI